MQRANSRWWSTVRQGKTDVSLAYETKHALVKKGIIENKDGNMQTAHVGRLKLNGAQRKLTSCTKEQVRKAKENNDGHIMNIPARTQMCLIDNLEPDDKGCCLLPGLECNKYGQV